MAATFVVEDGTGKTDANSYLSVAGADAYFDNRGRPKLWFGVTGATFTFATADNSVSDSASQFADLGFLAGQAVKISGAAQAGNNEVFTIKTVAAGKLTFERDNLVTAESAGNTVTIRPDSETYLRHATFYLDRKYGPQYQGIRANEDQALLWPRYGVSRDGWSLDEDEMPVELLDATAEAALLAAQLEDFWPEQTNPGGIEALRIKVGPIEEATTYAGSASQMKSYPILDQIIEPLLEPAGRVLRA